MPSQCARQDAAEAAIAVCHRAPPRERAFLLRQRPMLIFEVLALPDLHLGAIHEEPLGSVRHWPLSFSTYSPLERCVQVCAL